jgi:hypothetical protein
VKLIVHLVALALPIVCFGQASVQLVGVVNLPDRKQALLELSTTSAGTAAATEQATLREGERRGNLELISIRPDGNSAEVRWRGSNIVLRLIQPRPSSEPVSIAFSNLPLMSVLEVFSSLTNRTLLQHPSLPSVRLTLTTNAPSPAGAAQAIANALREQGIACVAYGQKFVKIVPAARASENDPATLPLPVSSTAGKDILPIGGINLIGVTPVQAARIYASLMDRQLDTSPTSGNFTDIGFKNATPLTKGEILHALDLQFAWRGLKIVPVDDKLMKLVPLRAP